LLDEHYPAWREARLELNALPLAGERWGRWGEPAYIEDLKRRKGPDADQPHRVAYKKLVRA